MQHGWGNWMKIRNQAFRALAGDDLTKSASELVDTAGANSGASAATKNNDIDMVAEQSHSNHLHFSRLRA